MNWQYLAISDKLVVVSDGLKMRIFHRALNYRALSTPHSSKILHSFSQKFFSFQMQGLPLSIHPKLLGGGGSPIKRQQTLKQFYDKKKAVFNQTIENIKNLHEKKEFEAAITLVQNSISSLKEEISSTIASGEAREDHLMSAKDFFHSYAHLIGQLHTKQAEIYDSTHKYEEAIESLLKAKQYIPAQLTREIERTVLENRKVFYNSRNKREVVQSIFDKRLGKEAWRQIGVSIEEPPLSVLNLLVYLEHMDYSTLMNLCLVLVIRDINGNPLDLNCLTQHCENIANEQGSNLTFIRNSFSSSEWVCVTTDEKNTIDTDRLCESLPGFIPSQSLEFVQCSILYHLANKRSLTNKIVVFPREMIYGMIPNVQCDDASVIVGAPKFIKQHSIFILKPVMCEEEHSFISEKITAYCKCSYKIYKNMPFKLLEDIEFNNPTNVINCQIQRWREQALEKFTENPCDSSFVEVDFKYLNRIIDNMNIRQDIEPNLELLSMIDESKQFLGFYMVFGNPVGSKEENFNQNSSERVANYAKQTGRVCDVIQSMCFRRGSSYVVRHKNLWEVVKLLGSKHIISCNWDGNKGSGKLAPLLMYYALLGGFPKVIKFIDVFWKEEFAQGKCAVMELMNPKFKKKKNVSCKIDIYKRLPGYYDIVCNKLKKTAEVKWKNKICEAFK